MTRSFPRIPSTPNMSGMESRSYQMAEAPLWLIQNYPDAPTSTAVLPALLGNIQTICGLCHSMPPAYDLEFSWNNGTYVTRDTQSGKVTNLEDTFDFMFQLIRLNRSLIVQPGLIVSNATWAFEAPPPFANACCNFVSKVLPSLTLLNMSWVLLYCNDVNALSGPVPYVPGDFDTSLLVTDPLPTDSAFTPTNFDPLNLGPASVIGWTLALIQRQITAPAATDATPFPDSTVVFAVFALYSLQEPLLSVDTTQDPPLYTYGQALFNCRSSNTFVLRESTINLPDHSIRIIPAGP